jgi:hypothetical protein
MSTLKDRPETDNEWLPTHCPHWCQGGHAVAYAEGCGWEISQRHSRGGGGDFLPELRNPIDHRVMRHGGGGYDLTAEQTPMRNGGYQTVETINLRANDAEGNMLTLVLTTGEARTLARQLIALTDAVDLIS